MHYLLKMAIITVCLVLPFAANAEEFTLTSSDIAEGEMLSNKYVLNGFGCKGGDVSPELTWSGAPKETKSFVVTVYDPDAPTGSGWWHWVVFNIPATVIELPRNAGSGVGLPRGAVQSRTDFGKPGFGGACPPPGAMHRYQFTVYALGVKKLDLDSKASAALVGFMTRANSIGSAMLTAVYKR
jgi:Raf kinase inhibitor-like YbhB/YbcL family protein